MTSCTGEISGRGDAKEVPARHERGDVAVRARIGSEKRSR